MSNLRPAVSEVDRSLREISDLGDHMRGRVLRKLTESGHLQDDRSGALFASASPKPSAERTRLPSPMAAARAAPDDSTRMRINAVLASARRLGVDIDPNHPIDIHTLNREIARGNLDERFRLKAELFQLGLIEA